MRALLHNQKPRMRCLLSSLARPIAALHLLLMLHQVASSPPSLPLGYRPNFVILLTDDQDIRMGRDKYHYSAVGSLEAMPASRKRLVDGGASLSNFFVNTPICCPSRTEFFTGRYFHNVHANGTCMHADTSLVSSRATGLFGLLSDRGYNTGVFGKVTNDQMKVLEAAGTSGSMTHIDSPVDVNDYTGTKYYHRWENGVTSTETINASNPIFGTTYMTSQIGNRTLQWLDHAITEATSSSPVPFLAYVGPHAPHYPATPAPWYQDAFPDLTVPMTPNYNLSCPDKAQHVRQNPPLTEKVRCWENQHFRNRWRSLLSVDDLVEGIYDRLDKGGVLNSTFFFFTSDHGYKQGQWRIGTSKQHPYETDIRVPFLVRGPGVPAGTVIPQVTGNVDLLPTLLELASGEVPVGVDGRSMASLLVPALQTARQQSSWRDHFLAEYLSVGTYYNDHSTTWEDENKSTTASCGGPMPRGPSGTPAKCIETSGVGNGTCYFVDSTHSNSWRALRVINASHDLLYVEYDHTWTFESEAKIEHFELYDVASDPYQMTNVYSDAPATVRAALHTQLAALFQCKGASCP